MINENFEHIVDPQYLALSPYIHPFSGKELQTVINTRYNVFLHHDFPKEDGLIAKNWLDSVDEVQSKWTHVIGNWNRAMQSDEPITLVRQGGNLQMPQETPMSTTEADYLAALTTIRGQASGIVSLIVVDGNIEPSTRVRQIDIGTPTLSDWPSSDDLWKGKTKQWGEFLRGLGPAALP